ncbi:MAG: acetolactate synthase large subunit [Alphaproteobacteria bacterium]|nr:acetolactate synthase large subunit [Alphaproteobacteria bacterium]
MKASDLLVKCLENEGITHIFGVPGEENADFMMSLEGSPIRFVLTRHEQGAAFMAEVYGRLTGNPACCLGTLGPGATNLVTGVADGNMDRAPMLVLTGQGATGRQHKESHQIMDVVEMYRPVTKWAHSILAPNSIPEIVRKAVRICRSEKPGAVLIELPEDVAKRDASLARPLPVRRYRRPGPDDKIMDRVFDALKAAKRPILIAGNGAIRKRASKQLRLFAEATGIGVISTFMGKGAVARSSPQCLFTIGLGQHDYVADAVDESDLVITVGYDMVEYHPRLWNPKGETDVVHIDFLPAEIDNRYMPIVEAVGDIAHALWMLNERVRERGPLEFDLGYQKAVRDKMLADFEAHKDDRTEGKIRPQKAIWDVRASLGPEDVLLSGVGAHKMWVARYYQCEEPNTCLIPNGFCSMGMPLPGLIAANLVHPDRKVFGIAGDGDFLMNVQEMETARRLNSNINIMVWVDGGYGLISWKQQNEFNRHTNLSFGNPDWLGLAKAFGWHGQYVKNSVDLRPAIEAALAYEGPSLIAIPIDYEENLKLSQRLGKIEMPI